MRRHGRDYDRGDPLDDDEADLELLGRYASRSFSDGEQQQQQQQAIGAGYRARRRRHHRFAGDRLEEEEEDERYDDRLIDRKAGMMALPGEYDLEPLDGVAGMAPEPAMAPLMPVDEEPELPVEIDWKTVRLPFRKEFSLRGMKSKAGVEINLGATYEKNKAFKDLMASGAYLGDVRVTKLRHNGPVSLAVRAESKPSGTKGFGSISLSQPNTYLAAVDRPMHAVISKRQPAGSPGTTIELRSGARVAPTWLSAYAGWSVADLDKKIKTTLDPNVKEVSTDHPVVHLLEAKALIGAEDLANRNSVHVEAADVATAKQEIRVEEADNPKISDATNLSLVFVRAHGRDRHDAGFPAWDSREEIVDDYAKDLRKASTIDARTRAPIVIEGEWELSYGHPAAVPQEGAAGLMGAEML